jgi:hypothetical protein
LKLKVSFQFDCDLIAYQEQQRDIRCLAVCMRCLGAVALIDRYSGNILLGASCVFVLFGYVHVVVLICIGGHRWATASKCIGVSPRVAELGWMYIL